MLRNMQLRFAVGLAAIATTTVIVRADVVDDRLAALGIQLKGNVSQAAAADATLDAANVPHGFSDAKDEVADADGAGPPLGPIGDEEQPAAFNQPNGFNARRTVLLYVPDSNPGAGLANDNSFLYLGFNVSDTDTALDPDLLPPRQFDSDNNGLATSSFDTGIVDDNAEFYAVFLRVCASNAAMSGFLFTNVNPDSVFNTPDYVIRLEMNALVGVPTTILQADPAGGLVYPTSDAVGVTVRVFPPVGLNHTAGATHIDTFLTANSQGNDVEYVMKRVDSHIGAFEMARLIARFDAGSTGEGFDEERAVNRIGTDIPRITVQKQVRCAGETGEASWRDLATAAVGSTVEFRIIVENTGNVDLEVTLQDVITQISVACGQSSMTAIGTQTVTLFNSGGAGTPINFTTAAANNFQTTFFGPGNNQFITDINTGTARRMALLDGIEACPSADVPGDRVEIRFSATVNDTTAAPVFCDTAACDGTTIDLRNTITATGDIDSPPVADADEVTATDSADVNMVCSDILLEKLVSVPAGTPAAMLNLNTINGGAGPTFPQAVIFTFRATNNGELAASVAINEDDLCQDITDQNVSTPGGITIGACTICPTGNANFASIAPNASASQTCTITFNTEAALLGFLTRDDEPGDTCTHPVALEKPTKYRNCVTSASDIVDVAVCDSPVTDSSFATVMFSPGCVLNVTKSVRCLSPVGALTDGENADPAHGQAAAVYLPISPISAAPGSTMEFVVEVENTGAVPIALVCLTDTLSCLGWYQPGTLLTYVAGNVDPPVASGTPVVLSSSAGQPFSPDGLEDCFALSTPIGVGQELVIRFQVIVPASFGVAGTATDCTNDARAEGYTSASPNPPTLPSDVDCTDTESARINVLVPRANCLKQVSAVGETADGPFSFSPTTSLSLPEGTEFPPDALTGPKLTYAWTVTNSGDTAMSIQVCDLELVNCVASSLGQLSFGVCDLNAVGCATVIVASGGSDNTISCEIIINSQDGFDHLAQCDGNAENQCYNNESTMTATSTPAPPGLCGTLAPQTDLCGARVCLRPPGDCPRCTKAIVSIWNQNEIRFSGTMRCICEWDSAFLTQYGLSGNHFLLTNIQTDRGKARIDGTADPNCESPPDHFSAGHDSEPLPMIGSSARFLRFQNQDVETTAAPLVGIGAEGGIIKHQILDSEGVPEGLPVLDPTPEDVAQVGRLGSLLVFVSVEAEWDAAGNVVKDTFIELTNDLDASTRVQMYVVGEIDLCDSIDFNFCLTPNMPTYWSAASGTGGSDGATDQNGDCTNISSIFTPPVSQLAIPIRVDPSDPTSMIIGSRFRGYIVLWAALAGGEEIAFNGLTGRAMIVDYEDPSAMEYEPWVFRALNTPVQGDQTIDSEGVTAGRLRLDGFEYSAVPDRLLYDFYTPGAVLNSGGGLSVLVEDAQLTLWTAVKELRHR